jgi:hypothetical protein
MKKKVLAVSLLSSLFLLSCSNKNKGYPELTFEKEVHEFGEIMQNEKVSTYFIFENTGDKELIIKDAKGSCGCTASEFPKEPIESGKKDSIKVTFDSRGKTGNQTKTVTFNCNTEKGMEIIKINAFVNTP